ncbi:hydrophobic protein [Streptomyces sp. NBC_01750]|uniref:hydrophobic protein n=1 Tax=Streptomyces sp. NBC_01750 TaxID=2975928 RepID=UPI002DD946F0|nr:hydrophobic protein [Streptomyces sp. NBC_01750]WSD31444.1 hydrophobic protein [Streptomyces sp. NBC_01750]
MLLRTLPLLLILVLFGFGFGFPMLILWYVAVVLLAVWILSFAVRGGSRSAHSHR